MSPRLLRTALAAVGVLAALAASPAHAAGDAARGEAAYAARCVACHSVDEHRVGPLHRGVYGRRAATQPEFDYTDALRRSGLVWNDKTLDAWLAGPEKLVQGQGMGVSVGDAAMRADLIAYLKTLRRATR
jgi:cytochrome c